MGRRFAVTANEDDPDIHDVGLSQAGLEQIADGGEKRIGVMACQERLGTPARLPGLDPAFLIRHGPGGIGGAVLAVGAPAQDNDIV